MSDKYVPARGTCTGCDRRRRVTRKGLVYRHWSGGGDTVCTGGGWPPRKIAAAVDAAAEAALRDLAAGARILDGRTGIEALTLAPTTAEEIAAAAEAPLSPGERVLTPDAVRGLGGGVPYVRMPVSPVRRRRILRLLFLRRRRAA